MALHFSGFENSFLFINCEIFIYVKKHWIMITNG